MIRSSEGREIGWTSSSEPKIAHETKRESGGTDVGQIVQNSLNVGENKSDVLIACGWHGQRQKANRWRVKLLISRVNEAQTSWIWINFSLKMEERRRQLT